MLIVIFISTIATSFFRFNFNIEEPSVTKVVRYGRTFLSCFLNLAKSVKYLHYKVQMNVQARRDIAWWIAMLLTIIAGACFHYHHSLQVQLIMVRCK